MLKRHTAFLVNAFSSIFSVGAIFSILAVTACVQPQPYPLSLSSQTLERDIESPEYREVLATMIPTDLAAEWLRVATPDNYHVFLATHGGPGTVEKDPELKKAYERRQRIATGYLEVVRSAYDEKKVKPPFDDEATLRGVLESVDAKSVRRSLPNVKVEVILTAPGAEKQWPCLRGPSRQGHVFDARMPRAWSATDNVVWRSELPGRGNSSPVVWDDRLWVTAEVPGETVGRVLLCFDRRNGEELWRLEAPAPKEQEQLYWKNTYASSTPVTDGERVIAFFGSAGLLCASVTGEQLWHVDLGSFTTMHGTGTTPVLYKDLLIVVQDQTNNPSLFAAFDKKTGEERWRHERPRGACWASPVLLRVEGRDELLYNGSNHIVSYDPLTGEELWRSAGTSREAVPMVVTGGGLLYSASGRNGPILAIRPGGDGDVTESHRVWGKRRGGPHVPSPLYHDDRLYIISDTGILNCLDAASGESLWQARLRGRFSAGPFVVGSTLVFLNEDGVSYLLKAGDAFELLGQNDLGEYTVATPAVLGGRMYFRTEKALVCVGDDGGGRQE